MQYATRREKWSAFLHSLRVLSLVAVLTVVGWIAMPAMTLSAGVANEFSWSRLEAAHAKGIEMINSADVIHKGSAAFDAFSAMKRAGAEEALDAPLGEYSANRAAAILNDFGFLHYDNRIKEQYYRRAIELDRNRKVAYLNLADILYEQLQELSTWEGKEQRGNEVADKYRKYLAVGGSNTSKIAAFLKGDLGRGSRTVCDVAVRYTNAGRLRELISDKASSVTTEEGIEDLEFGSQGTAHAPTLEARKPGTNSEIKPPSLPPGTEHLWGGDELGLFVYHNDSYIIYYRDMTHPVSMKALTPSAKVKICRFSVRTVETPGATALNPTLCEKLRFPPEVTKLASIEPQDDVIAKSVVDQLHTIDMARRGIPRSIKFMRKPALTEVQVRERYSETDARGSQTISFSNDGVLSNIVELSLSSGRGAGCDQMFFDTLNAKGTAFNDDSRTKLLMELQGKDINGRYQMSCFNDPRFFEFEGKAYFEDRGDRDHHRVAAVIEGKVADVCKFSSQTTVRGRAD